VHVAGFDAAPTQATLQRLGELLAYGDRPRRAGRRRLHLVVTPRLGTVSPWASKATDIARNCGLAMTASSASSSTKSASSGR
jgi:phosphoribosylformylglycinamidine synthase